MSFKFFDPKCFKPNPPAFYKSMCHMQQVFQADHPDHPEALTGPLKEPWPRKQNYDPFDWLLMVFVCANHESSNVYSASMENVTRLGWWQRTNDHSPFNRKPFTEWLVPSTAGFRVLNFSSCGRTRTLKREVHNEEWQIQWRIQGGNLNNKLGKSNSGACPNRPVFQFGTWPFPPVGTPRWSILCSNQGEPFCCAQHCHTQNIDGTTGHASPRCAAVRLRSFWKWNRKESRWPFREQDEERIQSHQRIAMSTIQFLAQEVSHLYRPLSKCPVGVNQRINLSPHRATWNWHTNWTKISIDIYCRSLGNDSHKLAVVKTHETKFRRFYSFRTDSKPYEISMVLWDIHDSSSMFQCFDPYQLTECVFLSEVTSGDCGQNPWTSAEERFHWPRPGTERNGPDRDGSRLLLLGSSTTTRVPQIWGLLWKHDDHDDNPRIHWFWGTPLSDKTSWLWDREGLKLLWPRKTLPSVSSAVLPPESLNCSRYFFYCSSLTKFVVCSWTLYDIMNSFWLHRIAPYCTNWNYMVPSQPKQRNFILQILTLHHWLLVCTTHYTLPKATTAMHCFVALWFLPKIQVRPTNSFPYYQMSQSSWWQKLRILQRIMPLWLLYNTIQHNCTSGYIAETLPRSGFNDNVSQHWPCTTYKVQNYIWQCCSAGFKTWLCH